MRVGVDIGGTKAVLALVGESGEMLDILRVPTGAGRRAEDTIRAVADGLDALLRANGMAYADVSFLGIGVPGTVSADGLIVRSAPNLGWQGVDCGAQIFSLTGIRPRLGQDTRAAALAEALFGAGKGRRCVACITLGTGIGCGIVMDGRIYGGALGTAGEVGHIPIVPNGRPCSCGRRGCMETYASGSGITRTAKERGVAKSSEEVFCLAAQGDSAAQAILSEAVTAACMAISALVNALSPDALLFSGGLCAQRALFVDPLIEAIRSTAYPLWAADSPILDVAALGADAPVIGAAMLDLSGGAS